VKTIALILGGGRGSRLHPLTLVRSKPAVAVAGKYRLIDLTVSNCINSGINQVFVLTQFQSTSLHRHIMHTYRPDSFGTGFVEILAAEQSQGSDAWYQGTADAVRQSLRHVMRHRPQAVLILSGDHLYRMDYRELLDAHVGRGADVTVAAQPVPLEGASRFGLLRAADDGRIVDYAEKPREPSVVDRFRAPVELLHHCRLDAAAPWCLASMGIYVFRTDVLEACLADPSKLDFGKEVIPAAIGDHKVTAFPYRGYWRDIGTIGSFYDAHMEMVRLDAPFRICQPGWPIYTHARHLPPARIADSEVRNSLVAEGADIVSAEVEDSVIGVRSIVRPGVRLKGVVLMGADSYEGENPDDGVRQPPVPLGVGEGAVIERAIVDKDARIGAGVVITSKAGCADRIGDGYWVRDGVTVIPKGAILPPGTRI
jgi:glucose-1-phosphate adenylyltransferase